MLCPSCGYDNIPGTDRCEQCLHSLMVIDMPCPEKGERLQKVMISTPISHILHHINDNWLMADAGDSMEKIVKILSHEKEGSILVISDHKLVGIITQRDILLKVAGVYNYKDLKDAPARMIMTKDPECVSLDDPISFAINKMAVGGFRRLPVLNEVGQPVNIVTIRDVIECLTK